MDLLDKERLEGQLKKAMEKGEMKKFLLGEGCYGISYREYDEVIESKRLCSIYDYYKKDPNVKLAFEQGLLDLINDSEYDIFGVFKYLMGQVLSEVCIGFKAPFELDKDVYIKLRQAILSKKEELQNIKSVNRDDVPVKSAYRYMEDLNDEYESNFGRRVY